MAGRQDTHVCVRRGGRGRVKPTRGDETLTSLTKLQGRRRAPWCHCQQGRAPPAPPGLCGLLCSLTRSTWRVAEQRATSGCTSYHLTVRWSVQLLPATSLRPKRAAAAPAAAGAANSPPPLSRLSRSPQKTSPHLSPNCARHCVATRPQCTASLLRAVRACSAPPLLTAPSGCGRSTASAALQRSWATLQRSLAAALVPWLRLLLSPQPRPPQP